MGAGGRADSQGVGQRRDAGAEHHPGGRERRGELERTQWLPYLVGIERPKLLACIEAIGTEKHQTRFQPLQPYTVHGWLAWLGWLIGRSGVTAAQAR
jgi:hypothetical protein